MTVQTTYDYIAFNTFPVAYIFFTRFDICHWETVIGECSNLNILNGLNRNQNVKKQMDRESHYHILNSHERIKKAWDSLKLLKSSLSKTTPSVVKQLKKADGSLCPMEEKATLFYQHFKQLEQLEQQT